MAKRLTRHNGRAGKSGVYKSTHNDRTFDTDHAGHIDSERIQQNIYWDCFRGATYPAQQEETTISVVAFSCWLPRFLRIVKPCKSSVTVQSEPKGNTSVRGKKKQLREMSIFLVVAFIMPNNTIRQGGGRAVGARSDG